MQKTMDTVFEYKGYDDCDSKCHLRVFEETGKPAVVIATELPDNDGTSVTNMAESLATSMWQYLEKPEAGLVWIEHYPKDGEESYAQERFATVSFTPMQRQFVDPDWKHITKEEVETMIGQPLDDETTI